VKRTAQNPAPSSRLGFPLIEMQDRVASLNPKGGKERKEESCVLLNDLLILGLGPLWRLYFQLHSSLSVECCYNSE
jgi:hypothetical protein